MHVSSVRSQCESVGIVDRDLVMETLFGLPGGGRSTSVLLLSQKELSDRQLV